MFELCNVSKRFGDRYALNDVSLTIGGGLNFITGASGSGKTTLLKIMSGMEPDYEGQVFFRGQDLSSLPSGEKCALYNSTFGFVWQDFNLLDDRTVMENILLPRYLKEELGEKRAMSCLRELKIADLADQKAGKLSGGQKQRVAIARELMKDPQVILADEPTSALDLASSREILAVLRSLAKRRAVIVVTHDTSLIKEGDKVYELDKGELTAQTENSDESPEKLPAVGKPKLARKNAFTLALTAARRQVGRTAAAVLSLLLSATLLLVSVSGAVTGSGQAVFDDLFAAYGDGLLDISLYSSFMSAGGAGGETQDGPKTDVSQDLSGLFERYRDDPRVQHVLFAQAFDNIQVEVDGTSYTVESTHNAPVFHHLEAGELPMGDGLEIAVPQSFVAQLGMTNEELLGKEVRFSGTVFNWESGVPVETPMACTALVVGVVDTTMVTEYGGQIYETVMDDSFFFSPAALAEMREAVGMKVQPGNFYIRTQSPADLISVKDELNAMGIVPLGRFELVEDLVRLNQQTAQQSGTAMRVIGGLALVVVLAVTVLTAVLRRREFAIERVCGFSSVHLAGILGAETLLQGTVVVVLFLAAAPLLNLGTMALWTVDICTPRLLLTGAVLCVLLSVLTFAVTAAVAAGVNVQKALRTGDR